jgi:RNA polymerase sigma-70 factor (ECF subfamily)
MLETSPLFIALFLLFVESLDTVSISVDVAQLVKRAQQGDREAVGQLYQAFSPAIYRYIIYRVRNSADAEDLTADVFIRMVQGLSSFQLTEAPFAAWLYRIAASRIADFYRENGRRFESELSDRLPDDFTPPEDHVVQQQSFERVRAALAQLSEEQQTILILRFVERRSHEDVAALLGKSITAVKSAQHRALIRLTEFLGGEQKSRHYLRGLHE